MNLLTHSLTTFLILHKNATARPLSANGEWSATLRGTRTGTAPWFSETSPLFDSQHRLIDRFSTPLHFHALGGQRWEIRSAGPDKQLYTPDDILSNFSG